MAREKKETKDGLFVWLVKDFFRFVFGVVWSIIRLPYWFVLGVLWLIRKIRVKSGERAVEKKREGMKAQYHDLEVIKKISGDYKKWEKNLFESDSKIGIILGARGSGKSAFAMRMLENMHTKKGRSCFAMGFRAEGLPSWITVAEHLDELKNDSFVVIDEAGMTFSSRSSMSSANKMLSDLILIARHKNLSIMFISQNSSNLEVNILRQADYLVLKPSSLLQKNFERKIIQTMYEKTEKDFEKFRDHRGLAYIYSSDFTGFISNDLPSFWSAQTSKSFK